MRRTVTRRSIKDIEGLVAQGLSVAEISEKLSIAEDRVAAFMPKSVTAADDEVDGDGE